MRAASELLAETRERQQRVRGERNAGARRAEVADPPHAGRGRRARRAHRALPRARRPPRRGHRAAPSRWKAWPAWCARSSTRAAPCSSWSATRSAGCRTSMPRPANSSRACASSRASCGACPTRSRPTR
ncbi:MAG: hypothetical protein MZW92_24695 [Comamonadaceae bacterium]|nr:hypothetical protein [Comamonadaceae bacterium]